MKNSHPKAGHFNVRQGKRVKIFYRDGSTAIARFKASSARCIVFFDHSPVNKSQIRTLTIYKGEANV